MARVCGVMATLIFLEFRLLRSLFAIVKVRVCASTPLPAHWLRSSSRPWTACSPWDTGARKQEKSCHRS